MEYGGPKSSFPGYNLMDDSTYDVRSSPGGFLDVLKREASAESLILDILGRNMPGISSLVEKVRKTLDSSKP